jgi:hypothetical protein
MVRSAILHTLQIDFSLQHVPYFSLQILKTLNKLTFGGPTVQTGLLPDPKLLRHLEEIAFSSSTSIRGQLSFGSFCLLCRRQASERSSERCSPANRLSIASIGPPRLKGKVARQKATMRSVSPSDTFLSSASYPRQCFRRCREPRKVGVGASTYLQLVTPDMRESDTLTVYDICRWLICNFKYQLQSATPSLFQAAKLHIRGHFCRLDHACLQPTPMTPLIAINVGCQWAFVIEPTLSTCPRP